MDHTRLLSISVKAALSKAVNKSNLEFYWYGPWNTILTHWFKEYTISPQHVISYFVEDSNGHMITNSVVPDFAVIKYYDGALDEHIKLIVENKRSTNKNLVEEFSNVIPQLDDQVTALFRNGGYKQVCGIMAIGKYWKWYKYIFVDTHTHSRTWSNESYGRTRPSKNHRIVTESNIMDISSGTYCNDFKALMRDMRRQ